MGSKIYKHTINNSKNEVILNKLDCNEGTCIIPYGVTRVATGACTKTTVFVLITPDTLTTIEDGAFNNNINQVIMNDFCVEMKKQEDSLEKIKKNATIQEFRKISKIVNELNNSKNNNNSNNFKKVHSLN